MDENLSLQTSRVKSPPRDGLQIQRHSMGNNKAGTSGGGGGDDDDNDDDDDDDDDGGGGGGGTSHRHAF